MAESLGIYAQTLLDGTNQTIYTVPATHTFIPKTVSITNLTTSSFPTVSIWFVKSGETPVNKNLIVLNQLINPGETVFVNPDMYLQEGYFIVVKSSDATSLNCQLSGVDMVAS